MNCIVLGELVDTLRHDATTRTAIAGTYLIPHQTNEEMIGGGVWGSNPPTRY